MHTLFIRCMPVYSRYYTVNDSYADSDRFFLLAASFPPTHPHTHTHIHTQILNIQRKFIFLLISRGVHSTMRLALGPTEVYVLT